MLYTIALTFIPGLPLSQQLDILRRYADVEQVIMHPEEALKGVHERVRVPCIQAIRAGRKGALKAAADEMSFCEQHSIQILPITSEHYPPRLRDCPDAPAVLYYRGSADLGARHIVAVVGTRKITEYGRQVCQRLTERLAELLPDVLVVSGLAYGVDIHAHRGALDHGIATVGVVAHGLDQIYPAAHRNDAKRIVGHPVREDDDGHRIGGGGVLTEYVRGTRPLQGNFLRRNRIVAGMADATIVVESAEHGGSLVTAKIAGSYQRQVYAFPGRVTDPYSVGCNNLILRMKATPILSADDFVRDMGWWEATTAYRQQAERSLFPEMGGARFSMVSPALKRPMGPDETRIVECLMGTDGLSAAELVQRSGLAPDVVSTVLFDMEMQGNAKVLPGGIYVLS